MHPLNVRPSLHPQLHTPSAMHDGLHAKLTRPTAMAGVLAYAGEQVVLRVTL
jgi:hypothetical protein